MKWTNTLCSSIRLEVFQYHLADDQPRLAILRGLHDTAFNTNAFQKSRDIIFNNFEDNILVMKASAGFFNPADSYNDLRILIVLSGHHTVYCLQRGISPLAQLED